MELDCAVPSPLGEYAKSGRGYEVGDLVCHQRYGTGIEVELPAPGRVRILFSDRQRQQRPGAGSVTSMATVLSAVAAQRAG